LKVLKPRVIEGSLWRTLQRVQKEFREIYKAQKRNCSKCEKESRTC
jgi:hypothetical protein